jgi:hypothetical protein
MERNMGTIGQFYVRGQAPLANRRDDFYPTPPEVTRALLSVEKFEGQILEPACGDGAMSRVLEDAGYSVTSADLVDRGYGNGARDFLMEQEKVENIVTNPPFKLVEAFIYQATALARRKVAILGRLGLLEGQERRMMWDAVPVARVWVFSRRVAMVKPGDPVYGSKGGKGGMIAYAWYVWEHGHNGRPELGWV